MLYFLAFWSILISYTDLRYRVIRNQHSLLLLLLAFWYAHSTSDLLQTALVLILSIAISLTTNWLGMGDAKLFVAVTPIAAHYGVLVMWQSWCWILGGIAAIVLHIKSRGKVDAIPFAPFIFAGLFLAIWTI